MVVDEVTRAAQSAYESLITVTVTTERQERSVAGTVFPTASRASSRSRASRSRPNSARRCSTSPTRTSRASSAASPALLGDAKVNIATFHLGRTKPGGDAIALVEVDGAVPADVLAKVQALPQVKQAKALVF